MNNRQESSGIKYYPLLAPLAWLYGVIVWFRNRLFDWNILSSESFDVPVISVGNITVGGTGKTPHIEHLIRTFSDASYRVAVLSRGYKRHTRGFKLVTMTSTAAEVGDEPLQIKHKFSTVTVAVDANRRRGIRKLTEQTHGIDIVLLDDAYQHRYVTPSTSILLTSYERMIYADKLLPVGRLREPVVEKSRANIVIVTKCPETLKPIDYRLLAKHLNLYPYQSLYFTGLHYDELKAVFPTENPTRVTVEQLRDTPGETLLVAGIASPGLFAEYISRFTPHTRLWSFGDHHEFTSRELRKIEKWIATSVESGGRGHVIVTEKDAARLLDCPRVPSLLKSHLYYLPLRIHFMLEQETAFNNQIKESVVRFRRHVIQKKK